MKQLVISALLATSLVLGGTVNTMAIEEARYEVIEQEDDFQIRDYAPCIVAEVTVQADLEQAGNLAFSQLFRYISGSNRTQQEIAMTAPVSQEPAGAQLQPTTTAQASDAVRSWKVAFMMPATFTMETLPAPDDPGVSLRPVPAHRMASVRYSGRWTEENYLEHLQKLKAWIQQKDLTTTGAPIWARYNPPFTPWFMRRNEVLIPVQAPTE